MKARVRTSGRHTVIAVAIWVNHNATALVLVPVNQQTHLEVRIM